MPNIFGHVDPLRAGSFELGWRVMRCPNPTHGHARHWLLLRHGRYGFFAGCDMYPRCTYTVGVDQDGLVLGIPAGDALRTARAALRADLERLPPGEAFRLVTQIQPGAAVGPSAYTLRGFDAESVATLTAMIVNRPMADELQRSIAALSAAYAVPDEVPAAEGDDGIPSPVDEGGL